MGFGKHIVLACECGFRTERAMVGHLLAHECSYGGFTVLHATYDAANQRVLTHAATLPLELENLLKSDLTPEDEGKVDRWFDSQRELIHKANGHVLDIPEHDERTDFICPQCRSRKLLLKSDGDWIA